MPAVDEAVVGRYCDVEQIAPVVQSIASPVDAWYAVVGILHAGVGDGCCLGPWKAAEVDQVGRVVMAAEECGLVFHGSLASPGKLAQRSLHS